MSLSSWMRPSRVPSAVWPGERRKASSCPQPKRNAAARGTASSNRGTMRPARVSASAMRGALTCRARMMTVSLSSSSCSTPSTASSQSAMPSWSVARSMLLSLFLMPSRSASRPGSGGSLAGSPSMLSLRKSRIAPSSEVTFAPLMQLFSRRLIGPVLYCANRLAQCVLECPTSRRPTTAGLRLACQFSTCAARRNRAASSTSRRAPDHQGGSTRNASATTRPLRGSPLHQSAPPPPRATRRPGAPAPPPHRASHFSSVSRAAVLPDRSGS